jgi:hypothetical protein
MINQNLINIIMIEILIGIYDHETLYNIESELCPYNYQLFSISTPSLNEDCRLMGLDAIFIKKDLK